MILEGKFNKSENYPTISGKIPYNWSISQAEKKYWS